MSTGNPWKTLSSRVVYKNPWFSVREDVVIRPDGSEGTYSVVQLPPSVGVVAVDEDGRVAMVSQWRYVHDKLSLEVPSGGTDAEDQSLEDAARRELLEETGLHANKWTALGAIDNSNGATTDVANLFLAEDLIEGNKPPVGDEKTELVWLPLAEAIEMAMDGRITESTSVAALLKLSRL